MVSATRTRNGSMGGAVRAWMALGWSMVGAGCAGGGEPTAPTADTSEVTEPGIDATALVEGLVGVWRDSGGPLDLAPTDSGWLFGRSESGEGYRRVLVGLTNAGALYRDTSDTDQGAVQHEAELRMVDGSTWTFCPDEACEIRRHEVVLDDYDLLIRTIESDATTVRFEGQRLEETSGRVDEIETDTPEPSLPSLTVQGAWPQAETVATYARIAVSRERCQTGCVPSRTYEQLVPSGALSVDLVVPELHPGTWYVTVFLDRNRNAGPSTSYQPGPGDRFALPDQEVLVTGDVTVPLDLDGEL